MSVLKDNLIKILEQNYHDNMCGLSCTDVSCEECPFDVEENKQQLIKELQND